MPGKLNLYNLGDLGVDLADSPVHAGDGSYTTAQNASVGLNQGQHGLRKRPGLTLFTSGGAMSGSVLAWIAVPFPLPGSGGGY